MRFAGKEAQERKNQVKKDAYNAGIENRPSHTAPLRPMKTLTTALLLASLVATLTGCAEIPPSTTPENVPGGRPGHVIGYLKPGNIPDSNAFLPPPPARGSAAFAADEEAYRGTRALRDTPRWHWAAKDADLGSDASLSAFACALGQPISGTETPHIKALLSRLRADTALATASAKKAYQRQRPYLAHGDTSCTPDEHHKADSYPSSHSAIGWVWALMLAEIAPQRGDILLRRGLAFGDSRIICGVHWKSDVEAGRLIGAATFSRLHSEPDFVAQMKFARKEIRGTGPLPPDSACTAELKALEATP